MNNKYLIIYHKEDNDGLFSMGIAYNYLIHTLNVTAELYGASYNDLSKITDDELDLWKDTYKGIIMVDISFEAKRMKKLYNDFVNNFIWIDHHAPIIKESYKNKFDSCCGIRQTNRSALLLTYKYFYDPLDEEYNKKEVPELLRILSAYDSFTFENEGYTLDYVMAINKAVTYTYDLDPDNCIDICYKILYTDTITPKDIGAFNVIGTSLINYDKLSYKNLIQNNGDFNWVVEYPKNEFNNRSACALFIQGPSNSLMFKSCKDYVDNGIVFKRNPDTTWTISLYNTNNEDDFHCGEYLKKKYKGGGHKGAAGCTITEKQFIKILKNKRV
jgi:oligoribonuclease NrnB/cAMP/cGMP phosphodiesterase (DHH superfamily)